MAFTQMNKKTRNGQKWGVVTLKLFNNSKIWIINEYFPKNGFLGTQCPPPSEFNLNIP